MTRDEAIRYLKAFKLCTPYTMDSQGVYETAKDVIIKTLEQESILDKIRAEIIQLIQNGVLKIESGNEALFDIIDKYKAEMENNK